MVLGIADWAQAGPWEPHRLFHTSGNGEHSSQALVGCWVCVGDKRCRTARCSAPWLRLKGSWTERCCPSCLWKLLAVCLTMCSPYWMFLEILCTIDFGTRVTDCHIAAGDTFWAQAWKIFQKNLWNLIKSAAHTSTATHSTWLAAGRSCGVMQKLRGSLPTAWM